MNLRENYSLKSYNTFGVNVESKSFFEFKEVKELDSFSKEKINESTDVFILGGGSNVLFRKNFEGIIIHSINEDILKINEDKENVYLEVGAGLEWDKFVAYCVENQYYGIENLSLIPGNIGAAPVQNIGAYGTEVNEVIHQVKAYDIIKKEEVVLTNQQCEFSYRNSIFKKDAFKKTVITSVVFKLSKIAPYKLRIRSYKGIYVFKLFQHLIQIFKDFIKALKTLKINFKKRAISIDYRVLRSIFENLGFISLKNIRKTIIAKRNSKIPSPSVVGNVGSFFKNPIVDIEKAKSIKSDYPNAVIYPLNKSQVKISAGWLIKQCGWQGKNDKSVGLYKDQTLIIVNFGDAEGNEIYDFSEKIYASVFKKFSIQLEREVVIVN
ncbi:FAD-binding protein [Aquimarina sp. BL5]|uniref:FAD-binding protein n=1 Tax=Aquimarina sp. BL5 TaxID=1714860 RepID=UPI000E53D2E3|nr:FAD-binding protein [Aquimarina sp. BL5]AXT51976.1 FAD-binding protein [Aquimarina sp. BL5]RKN03245.1 FAD-binding protein [Aquimarina sp. BL5]